MTAEDTIVAIATPLGQGGLGVIRLSGPQSLSIADHLFRFSGKLAQCAPNTLHHGWIESNGVIIDEAIASVFHAPHSYTGEDVVELSSHGSPAVLKSVVTLCVHAGARPAAPGEYTQRAFLNGKLDLVQAEAVAELIHANSEKARSAAMGRLRGVLSDRLGKLRQSIVDSLAHLEANLDFTEEEIPPISRENMKSRMEDVSREIEELLSTSLRGRWWKDGVRVALAGRPNAGKSSLFNALLAEERAIVTDLPGTTRDTLEERVEWDGVPFVLTDTAGLRDTSDKVESEGTGRARRAQAAADIVLLVVDGSRPWGEEDRRIFEEFRGRRLAVALNKSDCSFAVGESDFPWKPAALVRTSAIHNQGLSELKTSLSKLVAEAGGNEVENAAVLSNTRHVRHLEACREKLRSATLALGSHLTEESVALDLRGALEEINAITGQNITEDVLGSIFSQFCIGK